ncbi:MAG: hypothetical protein M1834_009267 [Cirrosporium novae-zelandiae]|nr:MAG: hypothetical protein M1834_009267 [Cirrosporium novae-zelandiae]
MATVSLSHYLWTRIYDQGIRSVFGVPGDFNLTLLDGIKKANLKWIGAANELNAAYAADGYARVKHLPGVLVTTYGVGELSALNAVAGAFSEKVKLIHIVGTTPRFAKERRLSLHHCLGTNPNHDIYMQMCEPACVAQANLVDAETAPQEIDRAIRECFLKSSPVYIFVPMDIVDEQVSSSNLKIPLDLSIPTDQAQEEKALKAITSAIHSSKSPSLLVDCLTDRFDARKEVNELADALQFPIYTTSMGKSIVHESNPRFVGTVSGNLSRPGMKECFATSDLILALGYFSGDANTGKWTMGFEEELGRVIMIQEDHAIVQGKDFKGVHLKSLLKKLISIDKTAIPQVANPISPPVIIPSDINAEHITQSWIWPQIGKFLRDSDAIIVETGTAQFGLPDVPIPDNIKYICQMYWGSIGYASAACLGAEQAQRENGKGRTVLVTGDGSIAMTSGEIGSMIKNKSNAIIIVVNNHGYTIERAIHGPEEEYNDVPSYRFEEMLNFFGDPNPKTSFRTATSKVEFLKAVQDPDLLEPQSLQVLEVVMDKFDIPRSLAALTGFKRENMTNGAKAKVNGFA